MPKQTSKCPTCGAKTVEYRHGLNRGLMTALRAIAKAGWDGTAVDLKTLDLTRSEWDNLSKLRYWGLVERSGGRKGGKWRLTDVGRRFVSGALALPKYAVSYRGEFRRFEGSEVLIHQVADGFAYRPEYASAARAAGPEAEPDPGQLELL